MPIARKKVNVEKLLQGLAAENTIISYSVSWREYFKFAGNFTEAMNATTLTRWRQHMVTDCILSASTINTRLRGIKAVARELYAHGEIEHTTFWEIREVRVLPKGALLERRRPHNRTRIEPEQMRALCTAPPVDVDAPIALRDRALMMTLATTGLRISEAVNVKVKDIQAFPGGFYGIANVLGKQHSEPRTVPLSAEAHSCILDWLAFRPTNSPYVFTSVTYCYQEGGILYSDKPVTRDTARLHIKNIAEELGMPHIKPHDFRRFVGTQLAKTNLRAAQLVLGHADISTTAKYYVMDEVAPGITEGMF